MHQDTSLQAYDGTYRTLGDRAYWHLVSRRLGVGALLLFAAVGLSIAATHLSGDASRLARACSWVAFLAAAVGVAYAFVTGGIVHRSTGFMLSQDAFKVRRGIFHKEEFAIPYRQIQNVEIERTFRQQMLGLSTLIISTAGNDADREVKDAPEGVLEAVDKEIAAHIQIELLRRANVQKVVDAPTTRHA